MKYFYDMFLMGISSSIMYFAAQILYRHTHRRYARWYYAMLVTASLMLIIPVQSVIRFPKMMKVTVPQDAVVAAVTDEVQRGITVAEIIFSVWAVTALAMLVRMCIKYFRTRAALLKLSTEVNGDKIFEAYLQVKSKTGIYRNISIRTSRHIHSPLLFGILRPMVIVPDSDFTYEELVMIMSHELMHYKHRDLLIKLITSVGVCIQWFNPFAYLLSRSLNNACELCCDESVLDMLNLEDKKTYGRLIISVIEASVNSSLAYTTAMAATEKGIQKRLLKIVEFRHPSRFMKISGVMLLISAAVCSVTAFGVDFAKEILPDDAVKVIEQIEDTPVIPAAESSPEPVQSIPAESEASVRRTPERRTDAVIPTSFEEPETAVPVQTEAPKPTVMPEPSYTPDMPKTTPMPTEKPAERGNTRPVDIVINDSINFDGSEITNENRLQIEAKAQEDFSAEEGQEIKAYIRVNDDGSYDLVRTETE